MRLLLMVALLAGWAGCAKEADLPDVIVRAATPEEYAEFRAELNGRFPADRLQPLDVATQELKLDALSRDVRVAGRDLDMCAKINGKTVHDALVLGWTARRARFHREIAETQLLLDDAQAAKARSEANGTPLAASVPAQIQSAGTLLDQLNRGLADAEQRLKSLESSGATRQP